MQFFPPLTAMLSSASTDLAKIWLDRKGWEGAFELLRKHNLMPTSNFGKQASALGLLIFNGFVDWYHAEDTPFARFIKELLRDLPSEAIVRMQEQSTGSAATKSSAHNPVFELPPDELKQFLGIVRTLDHATQVKLRTILGQLPGSALKILATTTDAADMATLLDLLTPSLPKKPEHPTLGEKLNAAGDRLAHFLVPGMGR